MERDLSTLHLWLQTKNLVINSEKTKFIIFKTINQNLKDNFLDFKLNLETIGRVPSYCYLGLHIDESLTWATHVEKVIKKITPYIGAVRRLRHYVNQKTIKLIYYSYINSQLTYCLPVWGAAPDTYMNALRILQNKFIKYMRFLPPLTPSVELYSTEILSLSQLAIYESILTIYKMANGLLKCNVGTAIVFETSGVNTRNSRNIKLPQFTMSLSQKSLFYRGVNLYNQIPNELKNIKNISNFKMGLKKYVYENNEIV